MAAFPSQFVPLDSWGEDPHVWATSTMGLILDWQKFQVLSYLMLHCTDISPVDMWFSMEE